MRFFLGTHHPHWLAATDVPLFVSHRALGRYKKLPRARGSWALDSGGFTELSMHGRWTLPPADYAHAVLRYRDEIGGLAWAAPQDWMCEPDMLKKTGLTVAEHQRRSIESVIELRALGAPVIPVLQGWAFGEYFAHIEAYDRAGIDLRAEPTVGVGTVCRRQNTTTASVLMHGLAALGIRMHAFGFKKTGLKACADIFLGAADSTFDEPFPAEGDEEGGVASSDTLGWSYHARREPPRAECRGRHINCANCLPFALEWREELFESIENARRKDARHEAEIVARRHAQPSLKGVA